MSELDTADNFDETENGGSNDSPPTVQMRIDDYFERVGADETRVTSYLYRVNDKNIKRKFVAKYVGRMPPDEYEVQCDHGGGEYALAVSVPAAASKDKKNKVRTFYMDIDDPVAPVEKQGVDRNPVVVSPPQVSSGIQLSDVLSLVKDIAPLLIPLFVRQRDPSISEIMTQTYSSANNFIRDSLAENLRMAREMQSNVTRNNTLQDDTMPQFDIDNKPKNLIETFAPLLEQFLPKLFGGGMESTIVSELVKNAPQFQNLTKDKQALDSVVGYLNETYGTDGTIQILRKLNVDHPILQYHQQSAANGGQQ